MAFNDGGRNVQGAWDAKPRRVHVLYRHACMHCGRTDLTWNEIKTGACAGSSDGDDAARR